MTIRLLLTCLLLLLGMNAHAAMDRIHSASGESSAPCPNAVAGDVVNAVEASPAPVAPSTSTSADGVGTPATSTRTGAINRPGLRWHSFLPGMMK